MCKVITEVPVDKVPADVIIHSLFGMSQQELVKDILNNISGKWNCLYE